MIYAHYSCVKRKEKGKGAGSVAWAQTGPTQRPGGETGRGPVARRPKTAWWRLPVRCWAGALRLWPRAGLGPAARVRGAGVVHGRLWCTVGLVDRGLGVGGLGPFPLSPPLRFLVHRAHPRALPSPLVPWFPFPRCRWTARRSGGAPVLHPPSPLALPL